MDHHNLLQSAKDKDVSIMDPAPDDISTSHTLLDSDTQTSAEPVTSDSEDVFQTIEVDLLMNDEQYEAVTKPLDSNVQVIAGPGTGMSCKLAFRAIQALND